MGTWGYGAFENDHALDWSNEFEQASKPLSLLDRSLKAALKSTDDAYECDRAIAAAEIIAALRGQSNKTLPESLVAFLDETTIAVTEDQSLRAIQACQKILDESELRELNENHSTWRKSILKIITKLQKPAKERVQRNRGSAPSSTKAEVKAICKAIQKAGGYVLCEKGVPSSAGTDAKVSVDLFENLGKLSTLSTLSIGRTPNAVPKGAFEPLVALKQLDTLELNDARVTDEHLRSFVALTKLEYIHLNDTAIGDAGLRSFAGAKRCMCLTLNGTKVTDEGLLALRGLSKLVRFEANRTGLTDAAMEAIEAFVNLEYLEMAQTKIQGTTFKRLSGLSKLKNIALYETQVDDRGIAMLGALPLVALRLSASNVSGACFGQSGMFTKLRELQLDRCPVTVASCKQLAKLGLRSLSLSHTPVGDDAIENLSAFRSLEMLDLAGTKISDSAIATLCTFKSLRHVRLSSTNITDKGLEILAKQQMVTSIVVENTKITLKGLEAFIGNPSVTYLGTNHNEFPYVKACAVLKRIRASQPKDNQVLTLF